MSEESKEQELPPLDERTEQDLRMGDSGPAYAQRTIQLRASLAREAALTAQVEEWKHSNLANWWRDHPRPADFDMNAYTLALEHRVRWLECGISAGREDRNGFRERAEKAEAELAALQDGAKVTYRPVGIHAQYQSLGHVMRCYPGKKIVEVSERILDADGGEG